MASISLEKSIRTCKVDPGWASRMQSDRFLNPAQMMCPLWNGVDTTGREVSPDSFYTKNAGCNSAEDRIAVENAVSRPQYMEYVNLSANGISGGIFGDTMPWQNIGETEDQLRAINNVTGNFGLQFSAQVNPGCNLYPYEKAQQQMKSAQSAMQGLSYEGFRNLGGSAHRAQSESYAVNNQKFRNQTAMNNLAIGNDFRRHSGMY